MEKRKVIEMETFSHMFLPRSFCKVQVDENAEYRFTRLGIRELITRILALILYGHFVVNYTTFTLQTTNFWIVSAIVILFLIYTLNYNFVIDKEGIKTYYFHYGKWNYFIRWDDIDEVALDHGSVSKTGSIQRFWIRLKSDVDEEHLRMIDKYEKWPDGRIFIELRIKNNNCLFHLGSVIEYYAANHKIELHSNCI